MFTNDNSDFFAMVRERDVLTKLSPKNHLSAKTLVYRLRPPLPMSQYVFSDSANGLRYGPVSDTLDTDETLVK